MKKKIFIISIISSFLLFCIIITFFIIRLINIPLPFDEQQIINSGIPSDLFSTFIRDGRLNLTELSFSNYLLGIILFVFFVVVVILQIIGHITGFSYNEVNIIIYYFLIPISWVFIIDRIFRIKYYIFTLSSLGIYLIISIIKAGKFSETCDFIFDKSCDFMYFFDIIGWNYYEASVYICVVLPLLVYLSLGIFGNIYRSRKKLNE